MRSIDVLLILCAVALPVCAAGETFQLKSAQTGRLYGPFALTNGATVKLGQSAFTVVYEAPRQPAPPAAEKGDPAEAAAARDAARAWLKLVDRGDYEAAWSEVAPYLQRAVKQQEFLSSLEMLRETLGAVRSREFVTAQFTESVPSAPDGRYFILQYSAEMENKRSAVETVVPMLSEDGTWRVSGYTVR